MGLGGGEEGEVREWETLEGGDGGDAVAVARAESLAGRVLVERRRKGVLWCSAWFCGVEEERRL